MPAVITAPVAVDSDDPAIWVNRRNPSKSLIVGTDKGEDGKGGLYVFGLDGKIKQAIRGMHRPNNVDIQTDFRAGNQNWDIAVATERQKKRLRVFRILPSGRFVDVTGNTGVFKNETGDRALPMGIALYRNPATRQTEAIVAPKAGPTDGYMGRFKLVYRGGKVDVVAGARFGEYLSKDAEIEAVTVDDARGLVFYSDERFAIQCYSLRNNRNVATMGREGFPLDREGLALRGNVLFASDQRSKQEGGSWIRAFSTNFAAEKPFTEIWARWTNADDTDGIELTTANLGPRFPKGILVVMNSIGKNFLVYDLRQFPG
jgi:3-phytase